MLLPRLALAAAAAATATGIGAGAATAADNRPPTEVVVEFDPASTDAQRHAALAAMGADLVETVGDDFAVVEVSPSARPTGAVLDVDPVAVLTASGTPDDPGFASQWHLRAVQAEAAWDVATGSGIVVAVIDSGVATAAPDLAGVRFVAGRDWVDGGAPDDQRGHGTHVTGTIAQRTNNGIGVAGLAHGAAIMPLRVLDAEGRGTDAHVAAAIDHAVTNGADVINLSLGGPTSTSVLQAAVARAVNAGVVVVAAAGNTGLPGVSYPAAYPGVVAVGAVDSSLGRASFSAFGPEVDIAAPGTSVVQQTFTAPGAWCYCAYSGTSMATPHVAAAAAILLSSGMAGTDVVPALLTTARDVAAPGRDDETGAGLLQGARPRPRGPPPGGRRRGSGRRPPRRRRRLPHPSSLRRRSPPLRRTSPPAPRRSRTSTTPARPGRSPATGSPTSTPASSTPAPSTASPGSGSRAASTPRRSRRARR